MLTTEEIVAEADRLCDQERYDEAFILDLRAAEAGHARAMTHLGWYYENGLGIPYNPGKAFEWYRRSADLGFAPAQFCLGQCYEEGIGITPDISEALRLYNLAANNGLEDAIDALSRLKSKPDPEKATAIARLTSMPGALLSGIVESLKHQRKAKPVSAPTSKMRSAKAAALSPLDMLRSKAEKGDRESIYQLGRIYYLGEKVKPDLAEARKWLKKAEALGDTRASFFLAKLPKTQSDLQNQAQDSFERILQKAQLGNIDAIFRVGRAYFLGDGVKKNLAEARRWLTKALISGESRAAFFLRKL